MGGPEAKGTKGWPKKQQCLVTYLTLDRLCLLLFPTTLHARSTEQESILMILILSQYIVENCPYCTKEGELKSLTINNIHVCNS